MQHVNNDAMAHFILILFICIWEEWIPNTGILKVDFPSCTEFLQYEFVCTRVRDER